MQSDSIRRDMPCPPAGVAYHYDLTRHAFDKLVGAAIAHRPRNEFFRSWPASPERPDAIKPKPVIPKSLVEELIKAFTDPNEAVQICVMAGLPRHHLAGANDLRAFWNRAALQISLGMSRDR